MPDTNPACRTTFRSSSEIVRHPTGTLSGISPGIVSVFDQVYQALEIGPPNPRITDAHLRGYDRSAAGWIATRIGCLVAAVEILRILQDRQPAFLIAQTGCQPLGNLTDVGIEIESPAQ
jgi:hypothetical protein